MLKKGIVFFVFIILLFSCKSTKVTDKNIKSLSAKNIIKKNTKATFDKKSVKASLIVKYIGKSNLPNLKASLRMEKDSIIWLSFSKLGFPVAKVMVSQNKVQFYEKITKTYFDGDFEWISKTLGYDFDFEMVQNLFLGNPLLNLKEDKYEVEIVENSYKISPKNKKLLFDIAFWINPYSFKLMKEQIQHQKSDQKLSIIYKGYTDIDKDLFPTGFEIRAVNKKRKTTIAVNFKNVIFDTSLKYPFKIPKSYKKIEMK